MIVSQGGTADKTSMGGLAAYLQVDEGATVSNTTATEGDVCVYGTATGGVVSANAQMNLYAGTANDVKVSKGGTLNVMANGTANDVSVTSAGLHIKNLGTANAAVIKTEGLMVVSQGGKASNTVVSSGSISVLAGGEVKDTDVKDQGTLTVEKDGTADKTTVWEGGSMTLRGQATETAVLTYGQLTVSGGAQATKATVSDNGTMTLEMGGSAIEATVYDGGALFVKGGGTATHTFLDDGAMYVSGGGIADGVSVESGGFLYLYKGAQATVVRESGGFVQTEAGANISFATTTFTGLTITGDSATVHSNTKAVDTVLADNGRLYIHSGGTATGTVVNNVGRFYLYSGGVASGATVNAGGSMTISSGAKATGKLTFAEGAVVSAYEGAKIDFDISELSPGNAVLVKNLSLVTGAPSFTLTVGTQELGTYALADGVTSFDGTITVFCNDFELGTISVGEGRKTLDAMDYTLTLDGGVLSVTLEEVGEDTTPPTITDITLSPLEPGVASVTVTATFNDNVGVATKQYRIGAGDWQDYTDAGVTVTRNTTVYFKAADTAGNEATGSCTVSNIAGDPPDITPPVVSNVAADITIPTKGSVTVTADFSDDGELKSRLYRLGGGEWTDYPEGGVAVTENGPVYFKAVDADGNESEVEDIVISNIDKKPPTITDFTLSTYAPAESVTVTAAFKDDVALASREYRIGDGEWLDYTAGVTVTENALLAFRAADAVGNETVEYFAVTNIGTVAVDFTAGLNESHNLKADEVASGVNINDGGTLWVSSGGTATGGTVASGGCLVVSNGGYATGIVAADGAVLFLTIAADTYAQGTYAGSAFVFGSAVTGITLQPHVNLYIGSGGTATDIGIGSGLGLGVSSGGTAAGVTVEHGGTLNISSGGIATVTENGGNVNVYDGADVTFTPNTIDGIVFTSVATLHSGTTATNATVKGGPVFVYGGGVVTDTTVEGGLYLEGGSATDTTVNGGGQFYLFSNGAADNTTVNSGGSFSILQSDGTAKDTTVNDGGIFSVYGSGNTANVVVSSGGSFGLYGKLTGKAVFETGALVTHGGAEIDFDLTQTTPGADPLVNDLSFVMGSGTSYTLTVNGTVTDGTYKLAGGATGFDKTITVQNTLGEGIGTLSVGDVEKEIAGLQFTLALTGADLTVTLGGNGSDKDLSGELHVGTGEVVEDINVIIGGMLYVEDGGVASRTTVNADGSAQVTIGGRMTDTAVNGGRMTVYADAVARNTTVNDGGTFGVDMGTADNTTVSSGGFFNVYNGATAKGVAVKANATLDIHHAEVTGKMTFEAGATVTVDEAKIDFDLTQTTPGADPLVNDLSFVMDSSTTYTLTVDGTEASGTYKLAGGATGFTKFISVRSTSGEDYGYLTFGGSLSNKFATYTLALTDGTLTVDLESKGVSDTTPPTVTNIAADVTHPTNGDVTVTAEFSDDVALKSSLYKLDGDADWSAYPEGGVVVDKNTTVYFKAVDKAGNECKPKFITIDNIDKVKPTITGITPSTTAPAASVTVTAVFDDDVELSNTLYRIGDGKWFNYNIGGVTVTENTTVSFKATDTAGNETVESYDVTNIDKSVPGIAEPDNDTLCDKKTKVPNTALTGAAGTLLKEAVGGVEVVFDTVPSTILRNHVGFYTDESGKDVFDGTDYAKVTLAHGAELSFRIDYTDAAKFTLWQLIPDKRKAGLYTAKSFIPTTLKTKQGEQKTAYTATIRLEAGEYYLSMQATDKKHGSADYTVTTAADKCTFFDKGVNSDDWTDMKTAGDASATLVDFGALSDATVTVLENEWVGCGDTVDYRKFTLNASAKLSFTVTATDAVKVALYQLVARKGRDGSTTYSLKQVQSTPVKPARGQASVTVDTKSQLLKKGDYYLMVQSTNTKKGNGADYTVAVNKKTNAKDGTLCSEFFTEADNSDDWTDMKTKGSEGLVGTFGSAKIQGTDTLSDWVGCDDAVDYKGFTVEEGMQVCFGVEATGASKFTVYELVPKTRGSSTTYSLKKLQNFTLKETAKGSGVYQGATAMYTFEKAGTYYFAMESTNAKKGGSVHYTVTTGVIGGSTSDALAMPETGSMDALADSSLNLADPLSFGRYDADVLADASASSLAELDGKSSWLNIASLA